ncbi:MAG: metallophosphoesterase [Thermoguttaceae bacterium]|nr:metallophosphoesterase [Thermoguttaceae bacterium]
MELNRRQFFTACLASGLSLAAAEELWAAAHAADFDFEGICRKVGWSPNDPDAFFFLHATDLHSSEVEVGALRMPHKFEGKCFVQDMNALDPRPAFVALTGDLISMTSMNPSTWDRAEQYFARYKKIICDRLEIPFWQIIGNNDCAAVPYKKVFPELPVYWSFERGGICFAGLHGYNCWGAQTSNHSGILYDAEQLAWLSEIVAKTSARTLVLFTHEPLKDADQHCARRQLAPIVQSFQGEAVWNIAGHNHGNSDRVIQLGGRPMRVVESLTPVGSWSPDDGLYRLLFAKNGLITASAYRWLTKDGEPFGFAEVPNWENPAPMETLEESFGRKCRRFWLVGEDDAEIRAECENMEDRISNLYFRRNAFASWNLPTRVDGEPARTVYLGFIGKPGGTVTLTADGAEPQTFPAAAEFELPEAFRKTEKFQVRIDSGENTEFRICALGVR